MDISKRCVINSMDNRIQACAPVMERICKAYEEDDSCQLISLMVEGQRELQKHGLGSLMTVHPLKTPVPPSNRGESMLEVADVGENVGDISDVGFTWEEVKQAAAVKLTPVASDERRRIEEKNEELVAAAHGMLGQVVRDECDVAVLSCNHCTAGLKAINYKARCSIVSISSDGHYSASKICEKCPSYETSNKEGLRYFVMEPCVEERFPMFIDLTIEACNAGSALAKPDTVLALTAKAHKIALKDIKAGKALRRARTWIRKSSRRKCCARSLHCLQNSLRSSLTR